MDNYKKYKSTTGVEYNFYVLVGGKEQFVSLDRPGATIIVRDMKLAKAIEANDYFKSQKIILDSVVGEVEDDRVNEPQETKNYQGITNLGDATDILRKEYGVAEKDVALKAQALSKAKELGISFPDWK